MNIRELYYLTIWYEGYHADLSKLYQQLFQPIQHNASQPIKQSLEPAFENLEKFLNEMEFQTLSLQQLNLLQQIGVREYIGPQGAKWLRSTVKTSDYDPATAVTKIQEAKSAISSASSRFTNYNQAVDALEVDLLEFEEPDDLITIRVGFKNEAAIENIADFKRSAADWFDIMRGLAIASNEPPETTKILGAGTGSIIVILATSVTVTTLLAIMSRNIASVAKDILEIRHETENLRQKKMLSEVMKNELKRQEKDLKDNAIRSVLSELKGAIPNADGEATNALEKSVKKLLNFNEKGGDVDFIAPRTAENDDAEEDDSLPEGLLEAKDAIEAFQEVRAELKLLSDDSEKDEEPGD